LSCGFRKICGEFGDSKERSLIYCEMILIFDINIFFKKVSNNFFSRLNN
jgi:hypothetical protein